MDTTKASETKDLAAPSTVKATAKIKLPKAVKVIGVITEISEASNGNTVLNVETPNGDSVQYWVNSAFWDRLKSRFREGDYVLVTAERRVADETEYADEDGVAHKHTVSGDYFTSMVKSSEARFMQEQKAVYMQDDIALIEGSANAGAVAAYLGHIRR